MVPYKFQDSLLQFCEKCHWYFDRDCFESLDRFGQYGLFNSILPVHEDGISLYLFVSSSISFTNILQISEYSSFASLVKFIPRYFILYDAIVNGIASLISLSDSLMFIYGNATDFYILILCPVTLLNSFIIIITNNYYSNSFLWSLQGFLYIVSYYLQQ